MSEVPECVFNFVLFSLVWMCHDLRDALLPWCTWLTARRIEVEIASVDLPPLMLPRVHPILADKRSGQ